MICRKKFRIVYGRLSKHKSGQFYWKYNCNYIVLEPYELWIYVIHSILSPVSNDTKFVVFVTLKARIVQVLPQKSLKMLLVPSLNSYLVKSTGTWAI